MSHNPTAAPQITLRAYIDTKGQIAFETQIVNCDVFQAISMLAASNNEILLRYKRAGLDAGMTVEQLLDSVASTAKTAINTDMNRITQKDTKN